MHLARTAPSPYYKPPILAYTKQTLSSVTTMSTHRSTRGQTAPSVSSLNDNATVPLHRIHPDIPPAVESTQITPYRILAVPPVLPSRPPNNRLQSLLPPLPLLPHLPPPLHINPIPELLPVSLAVPTPTLTNHSITLVPPDSPQTCHKTTERPS